MRHLVRATTIILLLSAAGQAGATTAGEFYLGLLRQGTSEVDAGEYDRAVVSLRLAAFGLIESIEYYQTAQVYLTLAWDRQGRSDFAQDAARRVVAAQKIERRYASLSIPDEIRTAFDAVVAKLLTKSEASVLAPRGGSQQQSAGALQPRPDAAATSRTKEPIPAGQQPPPATLSEDQAPVVQEHREPEPPPQEPARQDPAPQAPARTQAAATSDAAAARPAPDRANGTRKPPPAVPPPETTGRTEPVTEKAPELAAPKPAATAPGTLPAAHQKDPQTAAAPSPPSQTQPAAAVLAPPLSTLEIAARLSSAEAALEGSRLPDARRIYHELLEQQKLDREVLLSVAEGSYRARDFPGALAAFGRLGDMRAGEERFQYYVAVAYYETGQYEQAKQALAAALPFIELTPDVTRYRAKIEGAVN